MSYWWRVPRAIGAAGALIAMVCVRNASAQSTDSEVVYSLDQQNLKVTRGDHVEMVELGCEGRSFAQTKTTLYIACGSSGVVQLDLADPLAPRIVDVVPVDGDATQVALAGGRVWVTTNKSPTPHSLFAVSPRAPPMMAPPTTRNSSPHDLPLDVPMPPRKAGILAPIRFVGFEASASLSGFVTTSSGTQGGGILTWASVAYHFDWPIAVHAELSPWGVAAPRTESSFSQPSSGPNLNQSTTGGTVTVAAGHGLVGFDVRYFEIAFGAGAATVNTPSRSRNSPFCCGGFGSTPPPTPATVSPTFVQSIRVGARDGIAFNLQLSLFTADSPALASVVSTFQIPLSAKVMLLLRGGGGNVGFAMADFGFRGILRGDGGRGTLALTGYAGGVHMGLELCSSNPDPPFTQACSRADITGPALGLGMEWRP